MKYSLSKYKFFNYKDINGKDTIAAMSTYAGKTVKGYAKCNPCDTMDIEKGKTLAAARCNEKIAMKRVKRAEKKFAEAQQNLINAKRFYADMERYYLDANSQLVEAQKNIDFLTSEM